MHGFLDEICCQSILRFQDFSKVWSLEEWKQLKSSWSSCLMLFIQDNLSVENVSFLCFIAFKFLEIELKKWNSLN